jgi:murein DD-endopeptidase MepM/ murein hydrolase activator NlpD
MIESLSENEIPDEARISDGFDFPVGPRGDQVNVWATYKVDTVLVDPNYRKIYGFWHTGEDWNGRGGGDTDLGEPVYAVSHGRVVEFGYYTPSWGNLILLEHALPDHTRVWSQYAHLDQILVQETDQQVARGQQIGTIGKGEKTAKYPQGRWIAHLHFEIRRRKLPIDTWLPLVRNREQVLANYYNPTPFINEHRPQNRARWAGSALRPQVIVDSQQTDREAGTFRKARVDHWYSAPYGYQGTMLWTYASAETEANWAEWRPLLPSAGQWEVAVYIPEQYATTAQAHYRIVHAEGKADVVIKQNDFHNEWVRLGTYRFEPRQGYLRLSDVTGERRRGIMVGFDAIRWVKAEDDPEN